MAGDLGNDTSAKADNGFCQEAFKMSSSVLDFVENTFNPFPIIIPCHRAIRSDRSLGGYQGGLEMKRTLLEMEGIEFDDTKRIATKDFFY